MELNEYKNRKNCILASCSYNQVDILKRCLCDVCDKCKGECCQNSPCVMSPNEFVNINDMDYMKNVLDTGVLTIAPCNEGCNFYVIRPRGVKDLDTIVTGFVEYNNSCILQGENGCVLEPLFRPTGGLLLIPKEQYGEIKCVQHYSDFKTIEDWKKHQKVLKELIEIYRNVEIEKPKATEETVKKYKLALLGCKKETN